MHIKPSDFDKFYNNKNVIQAGIFDGIKQISRSIFNGHTKLLVLKKFWPIAEDFYKKNNMPVNKNDFMICLNKTQELLFLQEENDKKFAEEVLRAIEYNTKYDKNILPGIFFVIALHFIPENKFGDSDYTKSNLDSNLEEFINELINSEKIDKPITIYSIKRNIEQVLDKDHFSQFIEIY